MKFIFCYGFLFVNLLFFSLRTFAAEENKMFDKQEKKSLAKALKETVMANWKNPFIIQWHDGFTAKVVFASSYEPSTSDDEGEVETYKFRISEVIHPTPPPDLGNFRSISISIETPPKEIRTTLGRVLWKCPFDNPGWKTIDNLIHITKVFKDNPSVSETIAQMKEFIESLRLAQSWKSLASKSEQISETKTNFLKMEKSVLSSQLQFELAKKEIFLFKKFVSKLAKDYENMDPGFRSLVTLSDKLLKALSLKQTDP